MQGTAAYRVATTVVLTVLLCWPQGTKGQTFRGRALDEGSDAPVGAALVRLVDPDGESMAFTVADSAGRYSLDAPGPGTYRLQAERLGYDPVETPLLRAENEGGAYPVDLLLRRAPIPVEDLTVSTDRASRALRLMLGANPRSLRMRPFFRDRIEASLERGHTVSDMLRWSNAPSLVVQRTVDGPCFTLRNRGCLPVYLDRARLTPEVLDVLPLEMLGSVVILYPHESVVYASGAVLLFTEAWLR